ncbi:MAG: hypothetical protein PUC47_01810 [Oscillospiraceae bacterium]|nr:hypothetical protein [Oscillospiraceae bacterium]
MERFEQHTPAITRVPKKEHIIHPVKILFAAVLLVGMISVMLYGRVQITELGQQINAVTAQLDELNSEKVRMETEMEGMMSLKAVEEISVGEYGMVKPDASQVTYLQVQQNRVEAADTEETWLEKALSFLEKLGISF